MTPLPQHLPAANDGPPLDPPLPQPVPRGRRVYQVQRVVTPFRAVPRRRTPFEVRRQLELASVAAYGSLALFAVVATWKVLAWLL
jgi:hypothetical protein